MAQVVPKGFSDIYNSKKYKIQRRFADFNLTLVGILTILTFYSLPVLFVAFWVFVILQYEIWSVISIVSFLIMLKVNKEL